MWLLPIVGFFTSCLSLTNGVSYRGTNELQTKLDEIHQVVLDLSDSLTKDDQKADEILNVVHNSVAALLVVNNRLDELQKSTKIWSTHEHFITSWLDQISAVDRKLDIIIKGQERLNKVETQLNEVHQDVNKIDIDKFEHLLNRADKNQKNYKTTKSSSNNELFSFIDEYTTRGVLSSLNRIESELKQSSSHCSAMNNTVEMVEDIAAKVDILVDKFDIPVPSVECPKKCGTVDIDADIVIDRFDDIPEPSTEGTTPSQDSQFYKCRKYFDWFVIQTRKPDEGFSGTEYLNMTLADYKYSFYTATAFWEGLEVLADVSKCDLQLRVELWDFDDNFAWAEYEHFSVSNETTNYTLQVSGYSGNASDSLSSHNDMPFSTFDVKNDQAPECCPCAVTFGSGWWFNNCFGANLNGKYTVDPYDTDYYDGVIWEGWLGNYSLKEVKMMIKTRVRV